MANNSFTETFADGVVLTQTQLETALQSLKLDVSNTTQLTSGSTAGQFLQSNGDGLAASFAALPDQLTLNSIKNYGLSTSVSTGSLIIALKTKALADPSSLDTVSIPFSTNGTTSASYSAQTIASALSITIPATATLGNGTTAATRVFVYAINSPGAVKLAVSGRADLDSGSAITTTAISSAADNASPLYATATLTVVPRLLGWVQTAVDSSQLWQAATKVNITNSYPGKAKSGCVESLPVTTYTTSLTGYSDVTNLSASFTATGYKKVRIEFVPGVPDNTNFSYFATNTNDADFKLLRGTSTIGLFSLRSPTVCPPNAFSTVDTPPAGTYTYKLQARIETAGTVTITNTKMVISED